MKLEIEISGNDFDDLLHGMRMIRLAFRKKHAGTDAHRGAAFTFKTVVDRPLWEKLGFDDAWAVHPDFSRSNWQSEAADGNVQSGYWEWVASQIEQKENEDFGEVGPHSTGNPQCPAVYGGHCPIKAHNQLPK